MNYRRWIRYVSSHDDCESAGVILTFFRMHCITSVLSFIPSHYTFTSIWTELYRVTFKMVVDRMSPFRFVLLQLILTTSVLAYGTISHLKQGITVTIQFQHFFFQHSIITIILYIITVTQYLKISN